MEEYSDEDEKRLLSRAYGVFCLELTKHLNEAHSAADGDIALSPQQLDELRNAFHKVKGGAGFFHLDKLSSVAGALEKLLANHSVVELAEVRSYIEQIEALVSEMPHPTNSAPGGKTRG
jgi:HPt (histidine-containing phosphotransfer) domain-containing protein